MYAGCCIIHCCCLQRTVLPQSPLQTDPGVTALCAHGALLGSLLPPPPGSVGAVWVPWVSVCLCAARGDRCSVHPWSSPMSVCVAWSAFRAAQRQVAAPRSEEVSGDHCRCSKRSFWYCTQ